VGSARQRESERVRKRNGADRSAPQSSERERKGVGVGTDKRGRLSGTEGARARARG
jgi:hypothetical protein